MNETASPRQSADLGFSVAAAILLAGFVGLGWIGVSLGIGSLDANGIIHVVNEQATAGTFDISRPPGHPLSENIILPTLAQVISSAGISGLGYGFYQLAGGLFCLGIFWLLLGEANVTPSRRILAMACLAFSPQFLITSSDGEEFLWSMGFLFTAMLIVTKLQRERLRPSLPWWCVAVVAAVAAAGYRVEFGGMALLMVFGTLLFSRESWPSRLALAGLAVILFVLTWLPVILHHVAPPYPNPLSLKTRLAVGGYKIAFHAVGLAPFLVGAAILIQSRNAFRLSFLAAWALSFVALFFALFFVYPTKILEVLPGVAFLILLGAACAGRATWALFVVACLSVCLVHLDCFQDRKFVGLKLQPSLWAQNLNEKPARMLPQTEAASALAATGRHVVITSLWPWALGWQRDHARWPAAPIARAGFANGCEAYDLGPGVVASRDILSNHSDVLKALISQGYDVWIDRDLYREMYMRYDLSAPTPATVMVEGVPARVVEIR